VQRKNARCAQPTQCATRGFRVTDSCSPTLVWCDRVPDERCSRPCSC
jgi:hypothetical protein